MFFDNLYMFIVIKDNIVNHDQGRVGSLPYDLKWKPQIKTDIVSFG
jgi:hypothetical protein